MAPPFKPWLWSCGDAERRRAAAQRAPVAPKAPDHSSASGSSPREIAATSLVRRRPARKRSYTRDAGNVVGVILRVFKDGRRERIEYTANFDREYPVMGTEDYDHVVLKRIDENTSEAVLSHAGRVYGIARRVIAVDNKSMTITFRRENEIGPSVYNVVYYDRIALTPGEPQ
jgi:hypothetical protein